MEEYMLLPVFSLVVPVVHLQCLHIRVLAQMKRAQTPMSCLIDQ